MEKIYKIIKTALFIAAGVVIFFTANLFVKDEGVNISLWVGIVMAFYGLEAIIVTLLKKEVKEEPIKFLNGFVNIILAVIMIFVIRGQLEAVRVACTIWCIWSIMREGEEIFEKVIEDFKEHTITSVINFAESVVVIIFSLILIKVSAEAPEIDEVVEDAIKHVYLLGVELILEVVWPLLALAEEKLFKKEAK